MIKHQNWQQTMCLFVDKEGLSEEDESGEEEDLTALNEGGTSENRTATGKGKRKKKSNELIAR